MQLVLCFPLLLFFLLSSTAFSKRFRSSVFQSASTGKGSYNEKLHNSEQSPWDNQLEVPSSPFPVVNCEFLIKFRPTSIIYNYGVDAAKSGAPFLLECLLRKEASEAIKAIQEIFVAIPFTGQPGIEQQPIFKIVDVLPNLHIIRWPRSRRHHVGRRKLIEWGELLNRHWSVILQDKGEETAQPINECNSDTADIRVGYDGASCEATMCHLYEHLSRCRFDYQSLNIDISQFDCNFYRSRQTDYPQSFPRRNNDRFGFLLDQFPALHSLTLSGFDFDSRLDSRWGEESPPSASFWRNATDWSKLHHLSLERPPQSFLSAFHKQLSSLESLEIRPHWSLCGGENTMCHPPGIAEGLRQNYTTFIAALPPLHTLHISGMGGPLPLEPILETHGQTLRTLTLREFERDNHHEIGSTNWIPPTLNTTQFHHLALSAPHLERLTLNAARTDPNEWPRAAFSVLAQLPKLKELTLHFTLEHPNCSDGTILYICGCDIPELLSPYLNEGAASETSRQLRQEKVGEDLERFTVFAGDYDRWEEGKVGYPNAPVGFACWVGGRGGVCERLSPRGGGERFELEELVFGGYIADGPATGNEIRPPALWSNWVRVSLRRRGGYGWGSF